MNDGQPVLALLCGTSAGRCTADRLFRVLGTANRALGVPFTIDLVSFWAKILFFLLRIVANVEILSN
jgi:hypothetical protein